MGFSSSVRMKLAVTLPLISGSSVAMGPRSAPDYGDESSFSCKNSGPFFHDWQLRNSSAVRPQDTWSAGFVFVFTYSHCPTSDISRIVLTLLATNVLNLLVLFLMYFKTDVVSVQNTDFVSGSWSSVISILLIRTARTAAASSILGIVTCFSGATLVFAMTRATWTSLSWLVFLKYDHILIHLCHKNDEGLLM